MRILWQALTGHAKVKFLLEHHGRRWKPSHGPQSWAWRIPVSFSLVALGVNPPSTGARLWVYTPWGAWLYDVYFDRRSA